MIIIICASAIYFRLLSDMWDAEHERPFSCIDPATASKLLVVRGISDVFLVFYSIVVVVLSDDSHQGHHAEGAGGRA